jgi:multiple sugar transport system permease protein
VAFVAGILALLAGIALGVGIQTARDVGDAKIPAWTMWTLLVAALAWWGSGVLRFVGPPPRVPALVGAALGGAAATGLPAAVLLLTGNEALRFAGLPVAMLPGLTAVATAGLLVLLGRSRVTEADVEDVVAAAAISPAGIILATFLYAPAAYAFFLALFKNFNYITPAPFYGLGNFRDILADPVFWKSLANTAWYVVITVPAGILIGAFVAILLNERIRFLPLFRTIYFIPYVTALTATAAVWSWMYHPDFGLVNSLLGSRGVDWLATSTGVLPFVAQRLGVPGWPAWIGGPSVALSAIIVMSIWSHLGYNVVICLAGLQAIPREYYEAAQIDGATWWQQVRWITWPLLSPTTFFLAVIGLIGAFQVFTQIFILTPQGGINNSTLTIVMYLFTRGIRGANYSYGSAVALMLFGLIFVLTLLQRRLLQKRVHYEL